jgi:hypothetical protein
MVETFCAGVNGSRCQDTALLASVAVEYTERYGWLVRPVVGKKALWGWKNPPANARDPEYLRGLFRSPAPRDGRLATGVCLVNGPPSQDSRTRDFDKPGAYDQWAKNYPSWAGLLPSVQTGRAGGHGHQVHFRAKLPNAVVPLADGELRGGDGYSLLPPSVHPLTGAVYDWTVPAGDAIPFIADPVGAGLIPPGVQDQTPPTRATTA